MAQSTASHDDPESHFFVVVMVCSDPESAAPAILKSLAPHGKLVNYFCTDEELSGEPCGNGDNSTAAAGAATADATATDDDYVAAREVLREIGEDYDELCDRLFADDPVFSYGSAEDFVAQ